MRRGAARAGGARGPARRSPPRSAGGGSRFRGAGGLWPGPPGGGALQAALRALADRPYQHPLRPGERVPLGFSTIERWYYQAKDRADPIAALGRKLRADTGRAWALAPEVLTVLEAQYHAHPRWTVQLHS